MSYTNCLLSNGIQLGCKDSIGGVNRSVYLATFSASTAVSLDADSIVTAITAYNTFYQFDQRMEQAEVLQTSSSDVNASGTFYEQTINLSFPSYNTEKRNLLNILGQQDLIAIVPDNNGKYFIYGIESGMYMSASSSGLGKAYGDFNGVTLTLMGKSKQPAYEVNASVITTISPTY